MRISPVSSYNYKSTPKKQNVNFGKFADQNADDKVKASTGECRYWKAQQCLGIEMYTNKDGLLQLRIDHDFLKTRPDLDISEYKTALYMRDLTEDSTFSAKEDISWAAGVAVNQYDYERGYVYKPEPETTSAGDEQRAMEDKIYWDYAH